MTNDTMPDEADARMEEYLERAMARGTQIRRRRHLLQVSVALVAVCLLVVPLAVLGRSTPRPSQAISSAPYRLVSWSHVKYPGLNVADAQYPIQMGCGPGFPGLFPLSVQQVTYVRPPGAGETLALVLVKCQSGTPTPSSFYAFAPGRSAAHPRLLQVLLAPPNPRVDVLWYASHFQVHGTTVTLKARGVTPSGTICCPNVSSTMQWAIEGHRLVRENHR
jgi:hypothetical protein